MKRKILSILTALCLALTLVPATALAAGEATEQTGEDFIDSAEDGVISLAGNVALTSTATIDSNMTINLNGHTLSRSDSTFSLLEISGGDVVIQGTGTISGGNFETIDSNVFPEDILVVSGSANLTVDSVTISGGNVDDFQRNMDYSTLVTNSHTGKLEIRNSTVTGVDVAYEIAGRDGGDAVELDRNSSTAATITGSTLIGGNSNCNGGNGGTGLYISSGASAKVSGGSITGGQGNSGGDGVDVSGSVILNDVTITGGASTNSTPGVGINCALYAKSVTITESLVTGGSPADEETYTNSAGCGVEIYGPVILTVDSSTIQGGNNRRKSGDPIGGNAIWFNDDESINAKITLTDTTLAVGNDPAGDAIITGNANAPAGSGGTPANITAGGTLTVAGGTLKNTAVTPGDDGVTIVTEDDGVAEVDKNNLTVDSKSTLERDGQTTYYPTAAGALEKAQYGDVVTIQKLDDDTTSLPELPDGVTLKNETGDEIRVGDKTVASGGTLVSPVARVNGTEYTSLAKAIDAAKNGGTVELLADVTVDTWEQVRDVNGLTIIGNDHTLRVKDVESNGNGDYLFYGAENLHVKNWTITIGNGHGISMRSGSLDRVNITCGSYAVFAAVNEEENQVNITNCTFTGENVAGSRAIGVSEDSSAAGKLVVTGCTFTGFDYTAILYAEDSTFTGNEVTGGKLNVMHSEQEVTGNTFKDKSRVKFYEAPASGNFERNNISADSALDADDGVTGVDVSENYWGGGAPSTEQLGGVDVTGANVYYENSAMRPQDLNTYVPDTPSYDGGSSYDDSEPTYSPSLDVSDGGAIKVSPRTPEAGETVTITPTPEAGYDVGTVTVTDRNGREVEVTEHRNSTWTFTQPHGRVTIEVTFVRTGEVVSEMPFLDVAPDAWYYDAVAYVYENGMMNGTSANTFSPNATTTRSMIVTMLYRLEGEPDVNFGSSFDDVDAGMYYAEPIAWASSNGIVTGYDETTFAPNDAITREQMAAILYRYAQYKGYDTAAGGMAIREYEDYENISEYALEAMGWAVSQGLVTGTSNTALTPDGSAIRAQVATIFQRFMENVAE